MKALLKYLFVMALVLVGSDRLIGYLLDKKHENHFSDEGDGRLMHYLKKENADTLLMGSSRMLHNADPKIFGPKTLNLSRISTHIGYHAAVIDLLEQYGKLPSKMIVLNIEPEDFALTSQRHEESILALRSFYNKNDFIRNEINRISVTERLKHLSSIYRHNGNFWAMMKGDNTGFSSQGYIPLLPTQLDSIRIEESKGQEAITRRPEFYNHTAIRYLDHIRSICRKHNIRLVVVTAPYFETDKLFKTCSEVVAKVLEHRQVPYLNYLSESTPFLERRSYWHDNNHFNSAGAVVYSNDLKNRIEALAERSLQVRP